MASTKEYIISLLKKNEIPVSDKFFQAPTEEQFMKSKYYPKIKEVYLELGGMDPRLPLEETLSYDIQSEKAIIMIDEASTYNRYRATTLKSSVYSEITTINVENHKRYCRQFENECLKAAGNIKTWSDRYSEMHFGPSQELGELSAPGASLWKLNAFKSFLTDVSSLINQSTIFRISPHDSLMINGKMVKIRDFLLSRNPANEGYLMKYILRGIKLEPGSNK